VLYQPTLKTFSRIFDLNEVLALNVSSIKGSFNRFNRGTVSLDVNFSL
jgi:hypothetical protein